MAYDRMVQKPARTEVESIDAMPLDECREKLALLAKGISHPARIEIVRMLAGKPPDCQCICGEIVKALPLAQSSVSQHLKVLKETGWITGEPMGASVLYCLKEGILDYYRQLMERIITIN